MKERYERKQKNQKLFMLLTSGLSHELRASCLAEGLSLTKCRKELKGIYIHIADYVNGNYKDQTTIIKAVTWEERRKAKQRLRKRCLKIGFFPREKAKTAHLRALLKQLL